MTRLLYELDETTGLPRLRALDGALSPPDHTALEALLQRHYRRLVEDRRQTRIVRVRLASGPASFRVSVRPGASRRCPALFLERLPDCDKSEVHQPRTEWVSALLAEWEELIYARQLLGVPEAEQAALESALADLRRLGEERPDEFARLLLAGYLERARARSLTHRVPS